MRSSDRYERGNAGHSLLPGPDSFLGATVRQLWDRAPALLAASVLFSLVSLPAFALFLAGWFAPALLIAAVTIAPAWTGLIAVSLDIAADRELLPRRLLTLVASRWVQSTLLGIAAAFPILMFLMTLPLLSMPERPGFLWPSLVADTWLLGTLVGLYLYTVPLIVQHDIGTLAAIRQSAALASRQIGQIIGLVGMGIVFALAIAFLSSGLWFILPGIWSLFIASNFKFTLEALPKDT